LPAASPADLDRLAEAEIRAEQIRTRLECFHDRRPARFTAPGEIDPRLLEWAAGFYRGAKGNLVMVGNTGSGKTWSAWRLGEELLQRGYAGRIEIATAYQIKNLATPPADTGQLARLASADLLVLDDVGAVRVSDWDADHLYGLVDERWANERPTVVIANGSAVPEPGQTLLATLLGGRVASRIADGVTVVKLTGQDRRRPA
jgi:DNA replication protein DnaC